MSDEMNIKFEGGTTDSLRREFDERKEYRDYEGFKRFKIIDTHYEKFKYGMLNRDCAPITLISEQTDESLTNFPDLAENVRVLPFVAQAFQDFRREYTAYVDNASNPSISYPKYIEGLIPKVGYVNFSTDFARYINYNLAIHKRQFVGDPEIINFEIFVEKFLKTYEQKGLEFPITKSGFTTSEHCSIMSTGLCIELAEEDYNEDLPKGEMVLTSEFECFAHYANAHGFCIDKFVPWRIIADLSSEKMQQYIVKGRDIDVSRAMDLYESVYTTKSCYDDLHHLRSYLFMIYTEIHRSAMANEAIKVKPIPLAKTPVQIKFLLDILFRVRSIELGIEHENYFQEKQKIFDFYDQYGLTYVQGYIGNMTENKLKEIYKINDHTNSGY